MENVALFTVIFPGNLAYFHDFMLSLQRQTYGGFKLLLMVDGVPDIEAELQPFRDSLRIETKFHTGSIAEVRDHGIRWIVAGNYDYVIFADSDDIMHPDRIAVCLEGLDAAPCVVNDVIPFHSIDNTGNGYWRDRLDDGQSFGADTIKFCNFAGLGNSAIRKDAFRAMSIPAGLVAVDWFLFYHWLQSGKGVFKHHGVIYYRQHASNTAGLSVVTPERLIRVLDTKIRHMNALVHDFRDFEQEIRRHLTLKDRLSNDAVFQKEAIEQLNQMNLNFFWWEETQYIHE